MEGLRFLAAMLMKIQAVRTLQCVGWPTLSIYKLAQCNIPKGLDLQNNLVMENTQPVVCNSHTQTTRRADKESEEWKIWYWACDCNLAVNSGFVWENYSMLEIMWWRIGNFCSSLQVTSYTPTSHFTRGMSSSKVTGKADSCCPKTKSLVHTHTRCKRKLCEPQMETLRPLLHLWRCSSLAAKPHFLLSVLLVLVLLLKEVIM